MSRAKVTPYPKAWRIELPDEEGAVGVVVEEGSFWWVLCPATATLVLDPDDPKDGHDDGRGGYSNPFCADGDACDWLKWHRAAARHIAQRVANAAALAADLARADEIAAAAVPPSRGGHGEGER